LAVAVTLATPLLPEVALLLDSTAEAPLFAVDAKNDTFMPLTALPYVSTAVTCSGEPNAVLTGVL
jgi:hypothetical protein